MTDISIPGTMKKTYLKLPSTMSYEEWARVGKTLGALRASSQWAIGDWLNYGEHTFGEKYTQAADLTGLNPESLTVYQWVASRIPKEIRRDDLTHAHHLILARLEPEQIQGWLDKTAAGGWSVAELRAKIREKRAKAAKRAGETEGAPKFKVTLSFPEDPGEDFLTKLEAYVGRQGGEVKKAGW